MSVFVKLKPNWSSGSTAVHVMWCFGSAVAKQLALFTDGLGNCYIGLYIGPPDDRIIISDVGLFSAGVWANHLYTCNAWDWGTQNYYLNNVLKGTRAISQSHDQGFDVFSLGQICGFFGSSVVYTADSAVAELAVWDHELDADERDVVETYGPECLPDGRRHYTKILGVDSPEPAIVGPNLTLVGSPALVTHPTILPCPSGENTNRRGDSNILLAA